MTTTTIARPMPPAVGTIGAFHGISIDDYHGDHSAVSKSGLDDFRRHPFLYWSKRFDPNRPKELPGERETAARLAGNMLHCALLEPDEFSKRYVVIPATAPRKPSITQRNAKNPSPDTITAIDWWDKFALDNEGKTIVEVDQYDSAWRQAASLHKVKAVRELVGKGKPEVSEYFIDPVTGLYCKIRPDYVTPFSSGDVLLDAKTVGDASSAGFSRQVGQQDYHVQDGFYTHGHKLGTGRPVLAFLFAAVETTWPYLAKVHELDEAAKAEGERVMRKDLAGIARRNETGVWHDDYDAVETTALPAWAFREKAE